MSRALTLVLFDDDVAATWHPFTLTRPAGELLFGTFTFRERAEMLTGVRCIGHVAAARLNGFDEAGSRAALQAADIPRDADRLYLLSRVVLDWSERFELPSTASVLTSGAHVIGCYCPAGTAAPPEASLRQPRALLEAGWPRVEMAARVLVNVWDLITQNHAQLAEDIQRSPSARLSELPAHVQGTDGARVQARLGANVHFEPGVVIDTSQGPVWFDDDVYVRAFTRIAGPCYFGRSTVVLGGSFTAVSVGPACKVRGELEETVVLGYSNKAHDGFIGHSYLGRWVNLGANTTNSDLKNNYSSVRIWTPDGERDTGERKIGCFVGDHAKTAIGTLLNTGTVVGPGANLFGAAIPPKYVRPFSWGGGLALHDLARFLETARIVMERRGESLSPGDERVLRGIWQQTAGRVA
jgi:UDP-N-acetylglucosamine diphosphorylase/glucosamine-1-phosphate N-acetyltransferase